ncbi:MAG TPA: YebC/PmpR family DNA-binding transcriptional regulator [Candidatus Paceibacterota bacterium]|nr:YebC/PmpR family DNA-binding transcriptional regulator [Candidatus Paceibacterota bacterium]
MSGHNKWSKIKHKKAASDAEKSKIFGKLSLLITQESKKAGGDASAPGVRAAVEKAKEMNMPADNIDRAIKKGAGADAGNMEEVLYEAYGPGGVALIVTGLTDNKNRTAQEVKHALTKHGTALAGSGAAIWNFEKIGSDWKANSTIPVSENDLEVLEKLIETLEDLDDIQGVYSNVNEEEEI